MVYGKDTNPNKIFVRISSANITDVIPLQDGESQSAAGHPDDIIIYGGYEERIAVGVDDVLVVLVLYVPVGVPLGPRDGVRDEETVLSGVGGRRPGGVVGGGGGNADVRELAVVGRPKRVEGDEVQRVRVHVVSRDERDDGGSVVRLDEREVVRAHERETLRVLVREGRGLNGVGAGEVVGHVVHIARRELVEHGDGVLGRVIGSVRTDGGVTSTEEQHLDGVRETDVVRGVGLYSGGVRLGRSRLHLLNEDVTGSTGHALTLVIGHDGVVGPHLDGGELGSDELAGDVPVGVGKRSSELAVAVDGVVDDVVLVQ